MGDNQDYSAINLYTSVLLSLLNQGKDINEATGAASKALQSYNAQTFGGAK